MRMRSLGALALSALVAGADPAPAVNGYSFVDAASSPVNYDRAEAGPVVACASLDRLSDAEVTIETAVEVRPAAGVPGYCRVRGIIAPEVRFEVRLPLRWNRRLYMLGNGGYGGQSLDTFYAEYRDQAVRHGFATAMTNTGHDAENEPGATFAYRNLQKKVDWAYRATHLTAVEAKRLIRAFYDRPQSFSYFDGCSNGGRQGLLSAQRYPGDFDGIVAGAPLVNFTDTSISYLWTSRALGETPIPKAKLPAIAAAVMQRCDGRDGLKDGLIADPRACGFDPARDLRRCPASGDGNACFTAGELTTLGKIYAGPVSGGKPYSHGILPGAEPEGVIYLAPNNVETGWFEWVNDPRGPMYYQGHLAEDFIRYMAFSRQDPAAKASDFNFDSDPSRMAAGREMVDALDPDLAEFRARGGKLLMYHGWADLGTNPLNTVAYYDAAQRANGGPGSRDFMRLFLMPGVFHCFGGYGPDRLDALTAVLGWVEQGKAPDAIVVAKTERRDGGKVVRTRPICAYPQTAKYKGAGSIDLAASFVCADPPASPPTTR